ncbi:MAG TPA: tRNA (adenosine(37)-N6)-threonylcarbamoyltransferase complex transferase subunit TsaD [Chloroflexota bacterium]|jgi:N6-L-threonylcarbamoyladenine synthase|nr:tRNA (adenosine(37)-N6)-threonylcarbamoyltransferase complex transferase subunit TsaD [Chloroflexota bacterium]
MKRNPSATPTDVLVLGIETSCDETAAALVRGGRHVLANVVSSQIELHQQYGGVVPEIAARQHMVAILPVLDDALATAGVGWEGIQACAVTAGPGLAGALLVGLNVAKAIAFARDLSLLGVNHMEAHIYANWLDGASPPAGRGFHDPALPALCLIVSGGHTELIHMRAHGVYDLIGQTRDDAAGEAFDKVARILGLPYPGGPSIQRAAQGLLGATRPGNPAAFALPRALLRGSYDFSFSGLKTAAHRLIDEQAGADGAAALIRTPDLLADLAASFQEAVVDALVTRTLAAAEQYPVKGILLAGGVAANARLRERMLARSTLPVRIPPLAFCTDNAAIVAGTGYYMLKAGHTADLTLDIDPNRRLAEVAF